MQHMSLHTQCSINVYGPYCWFEMISILKEMAIDYTLRTIPTGSRNSLPPNLFNTHSKGQIDPKELLVVHSLFTSTELTKTQALHFHFGGNTTLLTHWTGHVGHICQKIKKKQEYGKTHNISFDVKVITSSQCSK